uniref:Uncharacterized protein n=1 Tax=Brugia timori TaxID=42155 RepID=A0A0R3QHJ4_9BILA
MEPTDDNTACITYFARHPEELIDESVASTSAGIFGNLFSRIFKPSKDINIANNVRDTTTMSMSSRHDDVGEVSDISMGKFKDFNEIGDTGENSKEKDENGSDILEQRKKSYIRFASIFKGRNPGLLDYERLSLLKYHYVFSSNFPKQHFVV